ncbi:MAG: 4Fe-4S binding protein [Armatimonadetes bacterium]|nr:4Fe-4S binding protein [Armatimonadota bacterium]
MSSGLETSGRPTTPSRRRTGREWHHYSNWLWVIMVAVIVGGSFYPLLGLAVAVCFAAAILSAPFLGRKWCGVWCPRGNFWDRIMSKVIRKPKMPAWAKSPAVRVGVLVVLMGAMTTQLVFAWGSWEAVGRVFVVLLTVTTAIGVFMALTGHPRAWCKVCPAGTMAYWLGRGKGQQLQLDAPACKDCAACGTVCPMDLTPHEMAAAAGPTHADCLKCSQCVNRCPVDALCLVSVAKTDSAAEEGKAA